MLLSLGDDRPGVVMGHTGGGTDHHKITSPDDLGRREVDGMALDDLFNVCLRATLHWSRRRSREPAAESGAPCGGTRYSRREP
jgi:hypothetical protein